MAYIKVSCSHCSREVFIDDNKLYTQIECAGCHQTFLAITDEDKPHAPEVVSVLRYDPDAQLSEGGCYYTVKEKEKFLCAANIKFFLKLFLLLVLIGGGIYLAVKLLTITPESLGENQLYVMTRKRMNREGASGMCDIAKVDFFPIVAEKEDFLYRDAIFTGIHLQDAGFEQYEGVVRFNRNGKDMVRPVYVDRQHTWTKYYFPFSYEENPEFLEEDGDLIFALAAKMYKELRGWIYVSGTAEGNTLTCTITKDGEEKTVKIKAEQFEFKDTINRIWVKLL